MLAQNLDHSYCTGIANTHPAFQILPLAAYPRGTEATQPRETLSSSNGTESSEQFEKAEIPAVLSSILLINGEALLVDVTSLLMPGCTVAVTSKTLGSLITVPHSVKMHCYKDMEATCQREKHLCEETSYSSDDGFKIKFTGEWVLGPGGKEGRRKCEKRPQRKVTHFHLEGGRAEAYPGCLGTNTELRQQTRRTGSLCTVREF